MRNAIITVAIGLLGAACVQAGNAEEAQPQGTVASAIVGGSASPPEQDATVLVNLPDGFCSGSLIAPNLVLTARHCVQDLPGDERCRAFTTSVEPSSITVSLGATADGSVVAARGTRVFVDAENVNCGHDIALVVLDHDIVGAKPARVRFSNAIVGEAVTAVGYGIDKGEGGRETPLREQRSSIKVEAIGPGLATYWNSTHEPFNYVLPAGEIATGESTCQGDSGGPLLDASGAILGVTAYGWSASANCLDGPSVFSDTATHEALLRNAAAAAGHPLDPVAEPSTPSAVASPAKPTPRPVTPAGMPARAKQDGGCGVAKAHNKSAPFGEASVLLLGVFALVVRRRRAA